MISGLTAAGKTTHAKRLATDLGIPYFSASPIFAELTGKGGPWSPSIDRARAQQDVDSEVDRRIVALFEKSPEGVFDAWALPWLTDGPAIRIWMASDFDSRLRKACVSELRRGNPVDRQRLREIVAAKDDFSRVQFRRRHGFDLFVEHAVFDATVDNSAWIPVASIRASDRGIEQFHPVLTAAVLKCAGRDGP
jgi:cytidylate kinase